MDRQYALELQQALAKVLGEQGIQISSCQPVSGGCINRAEAVELTDGRTFFVKSNSDLTTQTAGLFAAETKGLERLSAGSPIRTPQVIGYSAPQTTSDVHHILVLEWIPTTTPTMSAWKLLGAQLAKQHTSSCDRFGLDQDNFIGKTPQPNAWRETWHEFFAARRLGFQLELAGANGHGSAELLRLGDQLKRNLSSYISADEKPALLHGDLWSGNVAFDSRGCPVIFDPAVYYGNREAELALPALFGGFPPAFWESYQRSWPLPSGWERRLEIYKLYHLLNHLNLFGSGYCQQCVQTLRDILSSE